METHTFNLWTQSLNLWRIKSGIFITHLSAILILFSQTSLSIKFPCSGNQCNAGWKLKMCEVHSYGKLGLIVAFFFSLQSSSSLFHFFLNRKFHSFFNSIQSIEFLKWHTCEDITQAIMSLKSESRCYDVDRLQKKITIQSLCKINDERSFTIQNHWYYHRLCLMMTRREHPDIRCNFLCALFLVFIYDLNCDANR